MDLSLLKKIIVEKIPLSNLNLDDTLLNEEGKKIYEFIKKHIADFSKYPELLTVEQQLNISFVGITHAEHLDFYLGQLQKRKRLTQVGAFIKRSINDLDRHGDPDKILDDMRGILKDANQGGKEKPWDLNTKEDRQKILDSYIKVRDLKGKVLGIETPWPYINEETQGLTPGHFTSIISRSSTGKSWIVTKMSEWAHRQGKQILLVSPEMDAETVRWRLAAIYNKLPYKLFKKGLLSPEQEQTLRDFVNSDILNSLIIADAPVIQSADQVGMMVSDRRPDLVIVDSYFLLDLKGRFSSTNERREALTIELYNQCKRYRTPYVVTTHFTAKITQGKKGEAEDVAYTKQAIRLADLALALYRDADMSANKTMQMKFLKHREGQQVEVMISFDLENMDFSQLQVVDAQGDEVGGTNLAALPTDPEDDAMLPNM
jgi:replicative DNA helicase